MLRFQYSKWHKHVERKNGFVRYVFTYFSSSSQPPLILFRVHNQNQHSFGITRNSTYVNMEWHTNQLQREASEKGRKCNVRVLSEYSLSDERRLHSSQVTQITIKLNTDFVIFLSVYFHMINSTKWKASRWSWLVCHSMFTYVEFRVITNIS
jgi:hypothetical protein